MNEQRVRWHLVFEIGTATQIKNGRVNAKSGAERSRLLFPVMLIKKENDYE